MEIKKDDLVRGEAWGHRFTGTVYAIVWAGIPKHTLVSVRSNESIRKPMFTEDGDIAVGNTKVFNLIVNDDTWCSPCGRDWLEKVAAQ